MPCCVLVVALCATQFPHKNKKKAENAVSRVLSPGTAGTAAPGMVIYLGCGLPRISSGLPVAVKGHPFASESRLLLGLAPDEACHAAPVAGCPVGSYPTLSPLPRKPGRFAFCCAAVAAPSPAPPPVVDRRLLRRSPDFPPSPQATGGPRERRPCILCQNHNVNPPDPAPLSPLDPRPPQNPRTRPDPCPRRPRRQGFRHPKSLSSPPRPPPAPGRTGSGCSRGRT